MAFQLNEETELQEILIAAKQALEGVVAMDDEDEGPEGESLTCSEIAHRIHAYLSRAGAN